MIHENGNSVALGRKPVKGLTIHLKLIRNTFQKYILMIWKSLSSDLFIVIVSNIVSKKHVLPENGNVEI